MLLEVIMHSTIELTELKLAANIGTSGPNDVIPLAHLLDLKLTIDPTLVLIKEDEMKYVFDYDPLVSEIDILTQGCHYDTQERLLTRILDICVAQSQIKAVEIYLRKIPVTNQGGALGIRLIADTDSLTKMR